jgi:hypothetical protein
VEGADIAQEALKARQVLLTEICKAASDAQHAASVAEAALLEEVDADVCAGNKGKARKPQKTKSNAQRAKNDQGNKSKNVRYIK